LTIADSLTQLVPILTEQLVVLASSSGGSSSSNKPGSKITLPLGYPTFHFKSFLDRDQSITKFVDILGQLHRSFRLKQNMTDVHPSIIISNGAGIGKSRFGKEAMESAKKGWSVVDDRPYSLSLSLSFFLRSFVSLTFTAVRCRNHHSFFGTNWSNRSR
jgi:hypothetical protein